MPEQPEPTSRAIRADAALKPICHFLDMGEDKYGDCILVRIGKKSVLIDGAHPRDLQGQRDTPSIPEQLAEIFGHDAPFPITLIVVTHGHNDHIGCLPEMIEQELIEPEFALVTDPDHAFPPGARDLVEDSAALTSAGNAALVRILTGLAEEDHSDLPTAELELFLDRTLRLGGRYRRMLDILQSRHIPVVRWGTSPENDLLQIYEAFQGTGFDILAPSIRQLELCRDQIVEFARDSRDQLIDVLANQRADTVESVQALAARLYRGERASDFGIDRRGQGSALNCQSIMLKFGTGQDKVLLTGDMQFAAPEVSGIEEDMNDLLEQVVKAGPYRCLKLPHHSSYNGIDAAIWRRLGKPELVVHSGGSNDASHPEPDILKDFKAVDDEILFLRTDRNGLITIDLSKTNAVKVRRGKMDDFSKNKARRSGDEETPLPSTPPNPAPSTGGSVVVPAAAPKPVTPDDLVDVVLVRLPYDAELRLNDISIEVRRKSRSSPIVRSPGAGQAGPDPGMRLAGGRKLDPLLFVTASSRLVDNIGLDETRATLELIRGDAVLVDVDSQADSHKVVQRELAKGKYAGVVLVGGYDVLPAERVDVLDPELRRLIPRKAIIDDQDEFIVWSDDIWGDADGDGLAEVPVSRVPDGNSSVLVHRALTAGGRAASGAFGIRNAARPFADAVFGLIGADNGRSLRCAPTHFSQIPSGAISRQFVYFMLHGDDRDAGRFWGDDLDDGSVIEAINVSALQGNGVDIVFAGCCWGALTVQQKAKSAEPVAPRSPGESMALACLMAGARGYVGCTGVHYSPGSAGGFFGGPMHHAFWTEIVTNKLPPARALFEARRAYLKDMPHGRTLPLEVGIERKIYKQFTCLGLGW